MVPRKGAIAFCSRGQKGLITSEQPQEVKYADGTTGTAWTGIHITDSLYGEPWSSRTPSVVQYTSDYVYEAMINEGRNRKAAREHGSNRS